MSNTTANPLGSQAFRSALAELLGTFFLALAVLTVAAPLAPFAVGSLSGLPPNPAVTVVLMASRRFPLAHGLLPVVAQVAGAGLVGELGHSY